MYPIIRNPIKVWAYAILSGGLYVFVWVGNIAKELNNAEDKEVLKVTLWKKLFFLSILCVFSSAIILKKYGLYLPFLISFFSLLAFYVYVQTSIGNYIQYKEIQLNETTTFSNTLSLVLSWFFAIAGIAYMQSHINKIIRAERSAPNKA